MLKKHLNRINLIEGLIIILSFIWFIWVKATNQAISLELMINLSFLALFLSMLIFRSGSLRHMYFAFALLISSVIADVFGFNNLLFLTGGLTIGLFVIGVLNVFIFRKE